jgi:peroxiredoxin
MFVPCLKSPLRSIPIAVSLIASLVIASQASGAAPVRVGDFALIDSAGEFHQLSRYGDKEALVLMAFDASCDSMQRQVDQFQALEAAWQDKGIAFGIINAGSDADVEAVQTAQQKFALELPFMLDNSQLVTRTLGLTKAGEVTVLDPARLTSVYSGGLASVEASIAAKLAGEDTGPSADVTGCDLTFPALDAIAAATPDYATEVAPIVIEQCASCHREGGIGPFALDSHLMLQGWSPMIREVLLTKRMPPMQVDPAIGHFSNDRALSSDEIQKLIGWIDAGAPRGAAAIDPLAVVEFPDRKAWQLGEPDYIIKAPAMEIPATGVLDYIDIDVELPFTEDKWVKSVQFIAGDESVLHHLLTYVTAPDEAFEGGEADTTSVARRFLEGYAPGKVDAMTFPEGTGVFIPAGHKLSMQFHYTTNGKATVDETVLGLYMYDEPPTYENFTRSVAANFRIPAYAKDHEVKAAYTFQEDVVVTGLRAHMHFRGKDMKFTAQFPDGRLQDLLSVPNYSYAWQPTYELEEAMELPAGTKVHVTGSFDNSEYNPANPDPSKELRFGLQSWDEMFIGYWTYHAAEPTNQ